MFKALLHLLQVLEIFKDSEETKQMHKMPDSREQKGEIEKRGEKIFNNQLKKDTIIELLPSQKVNNRERAASSYLFMKLKKSKKTESRMASEYKTNMRPAKGRTIITTHVVRRDGRTDNHPSAEVIHMDGR